MNLAHLAESARSQAGLSKDERIAFIRGDKWIALASSMRVLAELEDVLTGDRQTRPRNLLVVGDPNSGKTTILERFARLHQADVDPAANVTNAPVVRIDCPDSPDRDALCVRILEALFARYKATAKYEIKRAQVVHLFGKLGVRVLLIDEIHHALTGTMRQQQQFLNALKGIGNETKINIVAAGIKNATAVFSVDEQMSSRFKPIYLPNWEPSDPMGELLASLETRIPLRLPSDLKEEETMIAIGKRAGTNLGDIFDFVRECAIAAVRDEESPEKITMKLIKEIVWTAPTKRKLFGGDQGLAQREADAAHRGNIDAEPTDTESNSKTKTARKKSKTSA